MNRYRLRGLDAEARTVLAEKILAAAVGDEKKIAALRQEGDFKRLMKLLAGYPLAMEVVLANLARQSAAEVLAGLDAADVNLDSGEADKTKSILTCVEYSHSNLSVAAQKLLLCLAPFKGFIWRDGLEIYGKQLQQLVPFKEYDFEQFDEAVQEAIQWGLLSPMDAYNPSFLNIQPIFPYFLRMKLRGMESAVYSALYEGFKKHYLDLSDIYRQLIESKDSHRRQLGLSICSLEHENLYAALELCFENNDDFEIFVCLDEFFKANHELENRSRLMDLVCKQIKHYPTSFLSSEKGYLIAFALNRAGSSQAQRGRYQEAKDSYKSALKAFEQWNSCTKGTPEEIWLADTYNNLGITLHELKEYENANLCIHRALEISIQLNDRPKQAVRYFNLGWISHDSRDYEKALSYYQEALDIYCEYEDLYSQARVYSKVGDIALSNSRDYEKALSYYQEALDIYCEYEDLYSQASTYLNLGAIACCNTYDYKQARLYFQSALDIYVQTNDKEKQASAYHNLAVVSRALCEYEQAESHLQRVLDIDTEFKNRSGQAMVYHQLGVISRDMEDYSQAQLYYQQALDIKIEYGARFSQASTYHQLGIVAEALREYEQARSHYQQALDIKIEFNDRYSQAMTYHNLGAVAQALREYEQARAHYQQALDIKIEFNDRYSQASTYGQLGLLAEAEEDYAQAQKHLQQALEIFVEFNDEYSVGMTVKNLARVYKETQDNSLLTDVAQCLNSTVEEVTQQSNQLNSDDAA